MRSVLFTFLVTGLTIPALSGAVRLPQMLSSHAVLQRDQPIHVWGWADPDEKVSVTFADSTKTAAADHFGHWSLYLPPHTAGGPFDMQINASNEILLSDLLVGDVWFASGQSNMEMPLNGFSGAPIKDGRREISQATQPQIRLLYIPKHASLYPLTEFADKVGWSLCTPETAASFSAVAYFFGRNLVAAEHVPIGLIDSTWGGTPAEAWTSMEGLAADASLMPLFGAYAKMSDAQVRAEEQKQADARADEAARLAHQPLPKHSWRPDLSSWTPAWLFNALVAPATPYPIKGVIWYQGESNTDAIRAPLYGKLFQTMISDWRDHWGNGDFPFLYVQIANYQTPASALWPLVREAQRNTLKLQNTAMAVTIDIGEPGNIHPADKQAVGERLALGARAIAYHENLCYSGPLFQRITADESGLRVWFKGMDGSLQVKGNTRLEGFEVAGDDHVFMPAEAKIEGVTVLVSNAKLQHPKYVRYGWQNSPVLNLFDSAGLPASPFTSEN